MWLFSCISHKQITPASALWGICVSSMTWVWYTYQNNGGRTTDTDALIEVCASWFGRWSRQKDTNSITNEKRVEISSCRMGIFAANQPMESSAPRFTGASCQVTSGTTASGCAEPASQLKKVAGVDLSNGCPEMVDALPICAYFWLMYRVANL